MAETLARAASFAAGALLLLGGLAAMTVDPASGAIAAAIGAVLMAAAIYQVRRYRSTAAAHDILGVGPGGGESGPIEPRFHATQEVFVDPTTQRLMRVYADPYTGERRYVAEA
jgi:hypothetical protein